MTDRLYELANELAVLIEQLRGEADRRELGDLRAPIDWLDESNSWLNYELARMTGAVQGEHVPFTYIPAELRK